MVVFPFGTSCAILLLYIRSLSTQLLLLLLPLVWHTAFMKPQVLLCVSNHERHVRMPISYLPYEYLLLRVLQEALATYPVRVCGKCVSVSACVLLCYCCRCWHVPYGTTAPFPHGWPVGTALHSTPHRLGSGWKKKKVQMLNYDTELYSPPTLSCTAVVGLKAQKGFVVGKPTCVTHVLRCRKRLETFACMITNIRASSRRILSFSPVVRGRRNAAVTDHRQILESSFNILFFSQLPFGTK